MVEFACWEPKMLSFPFTRWFLCGPPRYVTAASQSYGNYAPSCRGTFASTVAFLRHVLWFLVHSDDLVFLALHSPRHAQTHAASGQRVPRASVPSLQTSSPMHRGNSSGPQYAKGHGLSLASDDDNASGSPISLRSGKRERKGERDRERGG